MPILIPIQNKQYTIVSGDTLRNIAARVYGDEMKWPRIYKANQTRLKSGNPDLIYPDEVIFIPELVENKQNKSNICKDKDKNAFTLIIDDLEIPVLSGRVLRTMDTCADGWTAQVEWSPGKNKEIDRRLELFSYLPASVYLGKNLMVDGFIYTVESELTDKGYIANLEGWSFTADIIDSTKKPPYEYNNLTLEQLTKEIIQNDMGIGVKFDYDSGGKFERITCDKNDKIFNFLLTYASQRNLLISSTTKGELLFTRANTEDQPVCTLQEGDQLVSNWKIKADGRKRFNVYRALGKNPETTGIVAVSKDSRVPRSRFMTFTADESQQGNIQKAADWQRNSQLIDCLKLPLPVTSWYDLNGNIWMDNTTVNVKSQAMHVPDGFVFLINQVEYEYSAAGMASTLSLVPPAAYTQETIKEPW
jgi:prophage tail gpP-like protein